MSTEPQRTCPRCGNELPEATEFCPICMLRKGLAGGVESGESSASEDTVPTAPDQTVQRFEHYELVTGEDGKPVELGRGAMGVTYKAFDVDLHCPVTLNRRGFVFCVKRVRRRAFVIRTLPRSSTWAEPARTASTPWSLSRGKRSSTSSNAQVGLR